MGRVQQSELRVPSTGRANDRFCEHSRRGQSKGRCRLWPTTRRSIRSTWQIVPGQFESVMTGW